MSQCRDRDKATVEVGLTLVALGSIEDELNAAKARVMSLKQRLVINSFILTASALSPRAINRESWANVRNERWFEDTLPLLGDGHFKQCFRDLHTVDLSDFQNSGTNLSGFVLVKKEVWEHDIAAVRDVYSRSGFHPMFHGQRASRKPIRNAPYVMEKGPSKKMVGNDRFEGFCVDLLREMSRLLGFHYQLRLVRDGAYGIRDSHGHWNGMVRELLDMALLSLGLLALATFAPFNFFTFASFYFSPFSLLTACFDIHPGLIDFLSRHSLILHDLKDRLLSFRTAQSNAEFLTNFDEFLHFKEADLAIGDLTITYAREAVIDFTMPFMTLGVGLLYRKPQHDHSLLFFLSPLSTDVWLCVAVAYVVVSLLLCCVARAGGARWRSSYVSTGHCCCDERKRDEVRTFKSQFTLLNSLWFIMSAIMRQGCDTFPRSASTRILVAAWWLFSFVLVSSYTANLASFLTRERLQSPIESVEDLAKQTEVLYGCVRSGSTQAFFKDSKHETYERMWNVMKDDLVSSNTEGVERVERGGYAFLMESASIEYVAQRRCELTQLRGLLDSKGYGIAMPQGSPYRSVLSSTILSLQESGTLQTLKDRWWKVNDPARRCPDDQAASRTDAVSELGLPKVGGVFVVLLAGLGLACLIAFAEFFFKACSSREKRRNASTGASTSGQPVDINDKYLL
ncbi:hypothetical protein HPB51_004626 [Rhipicephalus microplus]|uniref:Uncharacterized protein n=1 Tax=Rhipicephalus microplus TaxID=6941 RepID=A0A9J6DF82_RHIMP|nr:hypothetical protein HPB51_004626 [Rhipicephalus microplus]